MLGRQKQGNEAPLFATTWRNPENTKLSGRDYNLCDSLCKKYRIGKSIDGLPGTGGKGEWDGGLLWG